MPIRGLILSLPNRPNQMILTGTSCTLQLFLTINPRCVQTSLMERVFTQEMDGRKIKLHPASVAALGLEDGGFGTEVVDFGFFLSGLGAVD